MATLTTLRESTSDGTLPAYVWPGGYPMVYFTRDGLAVCPKCANEPDTSDPVANGDVYWEGPALRCEDGSQCGSLSDGGPSPSWSAGVIESAYGDPDAEAEA